MHTTNGTVNISIKKHGVCPSCGRCECCGQKADAPASLPYVPYINPFAPPYTITWVADPSSIGYNINSTTVIGSRFSNS